MKKSYNQKLQQYHALVNTFKNQKFSDPQLLNPFQIPEVKYNYPILNPWNLWHGNLDAEILLIGQDWGDLVSFKKAFADGWTPEQKNPTNEKLIKLFECIGYDIGAPEPITSPDFRYLPLYFTNAVLGIKRHKVDEDKPVAAMSIKNHWFDDMALYLIKVINIIEPKTIIVMGKVAYDLIQKAYDNFLLVYKNAGEAIDNNGNHPLIHDSQLFAVGHCSNLGFISRSFEQQKQDWLRINELINNKYPNLKNLAL